MSEDSSSGDIADTGDADDTADTDGMALSDPPQGESRRARRRREKAAKPKRKAPWWEIPALIVLAVVVVFVVKTFVVQPFYIPSDSMEKTLHGCTGCSGDRILVNKTIYDFRDPHPGDIVVFHDPKDWGDSEPISRPPTNPVVRAVRGFGQVLGFVPPDGEVLVKRVIAIGGQTVKGDAAGNIMISNHGAGGPYRTLDEPFVYAPRSEYTSAGHQEVPFGPVTVPKGRLWVMGDHRTDSADSRYHCSPHNPGFIDERHCNATSSTVPVGNVIGKAVVIAWPPSRWRTLGTPSTFKTASSVSSASNTALPDVLGAAVVVPIGLVRRRRRRKRRP